jgi:DNA repair protein RadC
MLEKLVKYGGEHFENHELIEMLLFYSIPRINTNEIAHRLTDRFGSVRGILDATTDELCSVEGIGIKSAELIKLAAELYIRCATEKIDTTKQFTKYSQVCEYLNTKYIGASKEIVYLLVFNNAMRLIATEKIAEGTSNSAFLRSDTVLRCAYAYNSVNVILAHNHPGGKAIPSGDDITATGLIKNHIAAYGVKLIEHFVVADGKCTPIIHGNKENVKKEYEATVMATLKESDVKLEGLDSITFKI